MRLLGEMAAAAGGRAPSLSACAGVLLLMRALGDLRLVGAARLASYPPAWRDREESAAALALRWAAGSASSLEASRPGAGVPE